MAETMVLERLIRWAAEQHGFVRTADAVKMKVNPAAMRKLAAAGRLEHRGWGLYRVTAFPSTQHDEFHEAVLWANGLGIIGGEAALALWDLADVNPRKIEIIVPPNYAPRRQGQERYKTRRRKIADADIETVDNIPVLAATVAIADAITAGVTGTLIEQAITTARGRQLIGLVAESRLRVQLADRTASPTVSTR
ncbi:MAG: type IV toxin-antitoxin system AbiEi family antitoxin domain-containing protein [Ilumatobacteraceae bacterium]|jgi:predicted transcriptional regulator of viral defense system|nr:type IV toxin-antitoxin system AbiEi family antitoxin domain-containing protein [Ilumatobacteraceae bacterium]